MSKKGKTILGKTINKVSKAKRFWAKRFTNSNYSGLHVIPAIPAKNIPAQAFKPESNIEVSKKWIPDKNTPE